MKKKTNTTDKDFSWLLGVEDEAVDKSTSKAVTKKNCSEEVASSTQR